MVAIQIITWQQPYKFRKKTEKAPPEVIDSKPLINFEHVPEKQLR